MSLSRDALEVNSQMRRDPRTGIVQPWYTWPSLDVIQDWDLADKTVLEWGGGRSTAWWASRAKRVFTCEGQADWCEWIRQNTDPAVVTVIHKDHDETVRCPIPPECPAPDIAVVDGVARSECLYAALTLPKPLIIICDNWQQEGVYVDETLDKIMRGYPGVVHAQPGFSHPDAGMWQTAIWKLT